MLQRPDLVEAFEKEQLRSRAPDFARNLAILEGLYEEARHLGAIPGLNRLEGIEVDVGLARVLNVRPAS